MNKTSLGVGHYDSNVYHSLVAVLKYTAIIMFITCESLSTVVHEKKETFNVELNGLMRSKEI